MPGSRISISRRDAQALLRRCDGERGGDADYGQAVGRLRAALAPKRRTPAQRATREAKSRKRLDKAAETAEIRYAVMRRANDRCESCGRGVAQVGPLQLDHMRGRGKAQQSVANCWGLCDACHRAKTLNRPSAEHWLQRFALHADDYGYRTEQQWAEGRLQFVRARARASGERGEG